ncbi:LrgA family protein [Alcanivorax sp. S71-1-4]|jgi:holin-like protein|uniref:CidA/LrgA family protein n=1 Tax=Alcanivorax sp. S71-1-4 TaxID=1177159 RepID=UPI001358A7A8|nr:CidA/LrgA family protein [Alcanivorax sp. S71-1-4]KAF0810847.1 LrgA family protein [Alcanivorax sp. S71-1-4]
MKTVTRGLRRVLELAVLVGLYLFGTALASWLGWPVPGGVIGLALLLAAFATGRVQPASVQWAAGLLLAEMLLFFVPALMSLLDYGALMRDAGLRIVLVIGGSTLLVMLVTALTVEGLCRWSVRHEA